MRPSLELALPKTFTPGSPALRQAQQAERALGQQAASSGLGVVQVSERRHADGRLDAKVSSPWGTYCLRGPPPGAAPMSDRVMDRAVNPTTCP